MKETNSSNPSGRHPTPAPASTPNSISSEAESYEFDEDTDAYLQQVAWLSRLVTEYAMAEITPHEWVDLRAIKSTRYEPGRYQVQVDPADLPNPCVRSVWTPGWLLLSEGIRPTTDNSLVLPLPSVRYEHCVTILPAPPGRIPAAPPRSKGLASLDYQDRAEKDALYAHQTAWMDHTQSQQEQAEWWGKEHQSEALRDEESLARSAMQDIDDRRMDPVTRRDLTIASALERTARRMREA